jgi:hypothetical protein
MNQLALAIFRSIGVLSKECIVPLHPEDEEVLSAIQAMQNISCTELAKYLQEQDEPTEWYAPPYQLSSQEVG